MAATGPNTATADAINATGAGAPNDASPSAKAEKSALESMKSRLGEAWARLSNQQKIIFMVATAAVIALLVAGSFWIRPPEYRILFSNISERDGASIITALEQMNVPYRFSSSGGAILIPEKKVHETRLRLAGQGLPKGGNVGFELMENQKFGVSQFAEQINYQRGLEGELAKTIQSIASVDSARVHLAIPKPTVFAREELKPSASVMLKLHAGRFLDPAQIVGIQHLVSASVPNLSAQGVTVIDQSGAMLSLLKSRLTEAGLDPTQFKYIQETEATAVKRVEEILTPMFGKGNVHVQIAADIDFSQTEQTAETHRPNVTPPDISIRSQQTSETASTTPSALGIPGALSNQPPVPANAPLTQPPVPGAGAPPNAGQQAVPGQINAAGVQASISNVGQPINTRKDSTVNYEVDKTIRHVKQSVGLVKRLSAAVVINLQKDAKGSPKPLSDNELKQVNDLVKDAMGFNKDRGDTVSVANAPFTPSADQAQSVPFWKDPDNMSLFTELFKYLVIGVIILYLILKVIHPLVQTMLPAGSETNKKTASGDTANTSTLTDEEREDLAAQEARAEEASALDVALQNVRLLAERDPKAVAGIIKDWINGSPST